MWSSSPSLKILMHIVGFVACAKRAAAASAIPDLPDDHLNRFLNAFPELRAQCGPNERCAASSGDPVTLNVTPPANASTGPAEDACWGHEHNCSAERRFQTPICPGKHTGWAQSKQAQVTAFYYQADFGYVQQQIDQLAPLCAPLASADTSALECTSHLRFCRGRNLLFDFRDLAQRSELIRYQMDVLRPGQVSGHCSLNGTRLREELEHMGALQSWAPELRNFAELPQPPAADTHCDLVVDTPTFIMKIDATYNMYHHFCDFFNLYLSLFVNQSNPLAFHTRTQILIWETYPYDSPFADTFRAFSELQVWTLNEVKGRRVCFRNVVLPLLPRMIFGLFYNTPIIQGCQQSGLFRAFSEFILHRLAVPFHAPTAPAQRLRITFLARRTQYRQVLNEDQLLEEISSNSTYHVRRISFERGLSFHDQLTITRNTDILIGMHGAGLTHLLFLPNWATIFELHNCGDPNCYKDLARLRGTNYLTWQREALAYPQDEGHHPQGGAHAKFTNYAFDRKEFARLVAEAAAAVLGHAEYQSYRAPVAVPIAEARDEL